MNAQSQSKALSPLNVAARAHLTSSPDMHPNDYFDAARGADIHTETIVVTPEMAREWLKRNVVNRKLSLSYVERIVWDIKQRRFDFNHESVGFNVRDELIDGQHRLTAVVRAGVPVKLRVSFNIPAGYHTTMNVGRARSAADILLRSRRDTAVCSALIVLETGGKSTVSKIEITFEEHKRALEWARKTLPLQRAVTASLVAGFVYAFPTAEREVAEFAHAFTHFQGARTTDPVVVLRRYVESARRISAPRLEASLAALRCLQAHCEKESLTRLLITEQGFEYFAARRAKQ